MSQRNYSDLEERIYEYEEGRDFRGTQILLYGATGIGLLIALRRIRPFATFAKPSDIPNRFLKSKVPVPANVLRIEPNSQGPFIMVETVPLIPLPRFGKTKELPIKIANVDVTANGINWLQSVLRGKRIIFIPLIKKTDAVESRVSLIQTNENNLDIGKELVQVGFGMVHESNPELSKDKKTLAYYRSLVEAQKRAKRHRNGYWQQAIPLTLSEKLKQFLFTKGKSILPAFFARQLNI
ncbi:uncharacterized protein LOC105685350 [Athalia rosae]|uniref:uncharacterized protein LOC105685350 n=1 Tax=Athalia rosae TaxID=37344 RepID=UPI0020335F9C|nr:uncharacterized protein LOC105685350 [Athalia rosae]XP_048507626.1 uncharacterized protein LOC105685350 [Athalia rosae]